MDIFISKPMRFPIFLASSPKCTRKKRDIMHRRVKEPAQLEKKIKKKRKNLKKPSNGGK